MKNLLLILFLLSPFLAMATDTLSKRDQMLYGIEQEFDVQSATQAYLDTLSDEQKEQSDSYFEGGYWLILWGLVFDIFVAWLFLAKGLSLKLKKLATKVTWITNFQNFICIVYVHNLSGFVPMDAV